LEAVPVFRFFENLVDPYGPYPEKNTPPKKLLPFLMDYAQPFKGVFAISAVTTILSASIEIALIWAMGWVVDILAGEPTQVWAEYGVWLIALAVFILFVRPAFQAVDVALLNNTILPNFGTLIRWRAHRHVLRQSVGWFENDFAGRIANRIMQTPPAAGEAVFQVFDALGFSVAYVIGALILLGQADPRLAIPLVGWLVLYGFLIRWTVTRIGPASEAASEARSEVTGRVVDSYTNIHSVKMFAHSDQELTYAKDAIENTRRTFQYEMRLFTIMDVMLTLLNGLLIVAVVGWAFWLWM
jgi:ATP-binding cassette subfamily B multidrug efflux pump